MCLKEYILLLIEIFYLHKKKIESSMFPLLLPQTDNGAAIKSRIAGYLANSDSLRGQLRTLQWVWETNRGPHPDLKRYSHGLSVWIDEVTNTNARIVLDATKMITDFDLRFQQARVETQGLEVKNKNIQRERDTATGPPRALLSYNDVVAMKPTLKGRHNMSNKE